MEAHTQQPARPARAHCEESGAHPATVNVEPRVGCGEIAMLEQQVEREVARGERVVNRMVVSLEVGLLACRVDVVRWLSTV
eukprot:2381381-Prymnesium_polylepis.1